MITHLVLLTVRKDVPLRTVERVFGEIGALKSRIAGIESYSWGPYSSPEGMQRGYTHGFCMTFESAAARDDYLPHPAHEKVKARVLNALEGGVAGALAFDFES